MQETYFYASVYLVNKDHYGKGGQAGYACPHTLLLIRCVALLAL